MNPTPASVTWLVDLTPPDTIITSAVAVASPARSRRPVRAVRATFTGTDAGGVASFQCRVDQRPWQVCASPFTTAALTTGHHVVSVRAIDRAGNVDPSPARAGLWIRPRRGAAPARR